MSTTKIITLSLIAVLISGCTGKWSPYANSYNCTKIHDSLERAQCYEGVTDFNDELSQKIKDVEKENKEAQEKEKLDLSKKFEQQESESTEKRY